MNPGLLPLSPGPGGSCLQEHIKPFQVTSSLPSGGQATPADAQPQRCLYPLARVSHWAAGSPISAHALGLGQNSNTVS